MADAGKRQAVLCATACIAKAKHNSIGVVADTNRPLLERLHDFDKGNLADMNLIKLPPRPRPITCKPIFFDTAGKTICTFPDLSSRVEETKKAEGGFFNSVRSFFG